MVEGGEGTSQRTCTNGPWTWTTVWELTVGAGGVQGGGGPVSYTHLRAHET